MIAVMGATGHTGHKIAKHLLQAGLSVRAIGRSQAKLQDLARAGAEIATGDVRDLQFLTNAFRGADAVFTLVAADPTAPDYRAEQDRMGEAITQAINNATVRHVVALSSLGAEFSQGNGPIAGLRAQEERLRTLKNTHVFALRPAWFFENCETWLPLIKQQGITGDSLAPNTASPMVGTTDIAHAASEALMSRSWQGFEVRELLGPRDISPAEITQILSRKLNRPDLTYVQFSDADTEAALVQAGLSPTFAGLYTERTRAMNAGSLKPHAGRNAGNTTATDFETYADDLVEAYVRL